MALCGLLPDQNTASWLAREATVEMLGQPLSSGLSYAIALYGPWREEKILLASRRSNQQYIHLTERISRITANIRLETVVGMRLETVVGLRKETISLSTSCAA